MISASTAGPGVADGLDVELPELPVAAGLRAVVAEHRPDLETFTGCGQVCIPCWT